MKPAKKNPARRCAALLAVVCLVVASGAAPDAVAQTGAATGKTLTLGAGDQVRINVFQNVELALETRVDGQGRISYPFLGMLDVGNKSTTEVEQLISRGLESRGVLKSPQVSVSVTQFRSQQFSVLGFVNRPGQYALDTDYTVSAALAQASGINVGGADTAVLSRLEGGLVKNLEIDLVQMFRPGASREQDIALRPGDVLFVHRAAQFYVYGEVQRPGIFRLERDMTVMQALSAGGGLSARGTERGMRIMRRAENGEIARIDAEPSTRLRPDDVLYVRESLL